MANSVLYGFQFAHHGKYSGFSALKKVIGKSEVRVVTALRPQIMFRRGFRRLRPFWMQIQERRLYRFFKYDSTKVVHYFFPENSMYNGPKWKGRKKLIMTCHQPINEGFFDRLEQRNKYFIDGLKTADVIILMASKDIQTYQKFAPQAVVICIPHGVDTSFFSRRKMSCSNKKKKKHKQILTVGNWLRDYRFWSEVVKEVLHMRDDIAFTVIAGDAAQKEIRNSFKYSVPSKIRMQSGISDEKLRDTYAKTDLLFLPLTDAWANNALLEASSLGVPVMATDLPAVREYLSNDLAICFKNESAKATAHQLQDILADEDGLTKRGKALRMRMESEFSWEKIAECHLDLYNKLDSPKWPHNFK